MVSLLPYANKLNWKYIREFAGIRFYVEECSDNCKRPGHPMDLANSKHSKCSWYEEKQVLDVMNFIKKNERGREEKALVQIPVRWFNFHHAYSQVLKHETLPTYDRFKAIIKAINFAKNNCFDPHGEPRNIAGELGFSSYSKFLEAIEKDISARELLLEPPFEFDAIDEKMKRVAELL